MASIAQGYELLPLLTARSDFHTYNSPPAKNLCHLPRQRRDLWKPITPNGICKSAFYI